MFIALREETVGLRRSPMFSLAVDISLLWSEVVSITHPSYKHLTAPRSGPGQRSSTHYYPTTRRFRFWGLSTIVMITLRVLRFILHHVNLVNPVDKICRIYKINSTASAISKHRIMNYDCPCRSCWPLLLRYNVGTCPARQKKNDLDGALADYTKMIEIDHTHP